MIVVGFCCDVRYASSVVRTFELNPGWHFWNEMPLGFSTLLWAPLFVIEPLASTYSADEDLASLTA